MKNFIMVLASMIFIFAAAMLVGNGTENKEIGTCAGYALGEETFGELTEFFNTNGWPHTDM